MVAAMETKRVLSKVASQMGYSALRPKQEEVILDFVRGSDVFVSLPTGSGKSMSTIHVSCSCRTLPDRSGEGLSN